ncbi:MAG: hypothetical protein AAB871_00330 [Patescibacteria group bacterium]
MVSELEEFVFPEDGLGLGDSGVVLSSSCDWIFSEIFGAVPVGIGCSGLESGAVPGSKTTARAALACVKNIMWKKIIEIIRRRWFINLKI